MPRRDPDADLVLDLLKRVRAVAPELTSLQWLELEYRAREAFGGRRFYVRATPRQRDVGTPLPRDDRGV